jgi:predicted Ser/Thr protein kinase
MAHLITLQKSAGNAAVARLLSARPTPAPQAVARLAVSEQPVNASKLSSAKELTGGHKGIVFSLESKAGEKLVVKLQNESPKEALAGTAVVKAAGGLTPVVRLATPIDIGNIAAGLGKLGKQFKAVKVKFAAERKARTYVLLMDFASGKSLQKLSEKEPDKLVQALQSRSLQESLGRILAADAFSGNPDRAMAVKTGEKEVAKTKVPIMGGWFHEQNLKIDEQNGAFLAVAIDNAFAPTLSTRSAPFGMRAQTAGMQIGSIAAANDKLFRQELGLIFDKIVEYMTSKEQWKDPDGSKTKDLVAAKAGFVNGAAAGAASAMTELLKPGQHWKGAFRLAGAEPQDIDQFRIRKRYMRLINLGIDATKAKDIARDNQRYRSVVAARALL